MGIMTSNKWMCPECGHRGVSDGDYAPLCHEEPCNYNVWMVAISEHLYQVLGHDERKAKDCRDYHAGVPISSQTYKPTRRKMDMYALIRGNEDGNPILLLNDQWLQELLTNPVEFAGIKEFKDGNWFGQHPDANYWPEGIGVLVKIEAVVPKAVTVAYVIE